MKVLVYVDGSEASMRAVDRAIELGKTGSALTVLHVYPPRLDRDLVSQFEIEPEDLDVRFGRRVLDEVSHRLADRGVAAEVHLAEGALAEVIRQRAEEGNFDLILMGGRNESSGRPFDLSEIIRRKSAVPVEVVT